MFLNNIKRFTKIFKVFERKRISFLLMVFEKVGLSFFKYDSKNLIKPGTLRIMHPKTFVHTIKTLNFLLQFVLFASL